jgi:hypothetical protein
MKSVVLRFCVCLWSLVGVSGQLQGQPNNQDDHLLSQAEDFIEAFYTFEPARLTPLISYAPSSADEILFYQGWAKGANYKIIHRSPCYKASVNSVKCAIKVADDLVLALNLDFHVTDTFTLTFQQGNIVAINTRSNDKPVYLDAYRWVVRQYPEIMQGPCKGFFVDGPTPVKCAEKMAQAYAKYSEIHGL